MRQQEEKSDLFSFACSVLADLISDATATKVAIDEAYEGIEKVNEQIRQVAPQPPAPVAESDFLGGWGDDIAGQPPLPTIASSGTYGSGESTDDRNPVAEESASQQPQLQLNNANSLQPNPSSYSYNTDSALSSTSAPATDMYSGGGYTLDRGVLQRETSEGFGEVMGGGSTPLPQQPSGFTSGGTSMSATSTFDSIPVAVSMKDVEDLKSKSKEADDVAKEAEASRRQLVAQLEELRKVADEAESKARAATDKPAKKKGLLGRGGTQKKEAVCGSAISCDCIISTIWTISRAHRF
jgi:hypothetical protein